eukprot:GHVH01004618.1.p1 GENE.GHVH01004618.1~~GHVH01004618.1.p1  ORF type:complete len:1004 (+),score=166.10 GHVH01004618.1:64-3075(+)
MNDSLYDEFGNFLGEVSSEEETLDHEDGHAPQDPSIPADEEGLTEEDMMEKANIEEEFETSMAIAEHYPTAQEVYGPNVETLVGDADTQPLEQPLVAPVLEKKFDSVFKEPLEVEFEWQFVQELAKTSPDSIRNVVLVGNLHHGKTLLSDIFIQRTHPDGRWDVEKTGRGFLDYRADERSRLLSVKSVPFTSCLPDPTGKSWVLNLLDTPGHPNFIDEAVVAITGSDVAAIVVDCLCGIEKNTVKLIKEAATQGLDLVLVINCIDRLILELKLPPQDAYHKIRHTIEQVNIVIRELSEQLGKSIATFKPQSGNVLFAAGKFSFIFSLSSISRRYSSAYARLNASAMDPKRGVRVLPDLDHVELSNRLWGDIYFNRRTNRFQKDSLDSESGERLPRSFVDFVLDPIWKIFATCTGEEQPTVESVLGELDIKLPKETYRMNTRDLLHEACKAFFHDSVESFVEAVVGCGSSPLSLSATKIRTQYSGILPAVSDLNKDLMSLNREGFLMAHIFKNYHRSDCKQFDCLARVYSGTLKKGCMVRVLGPKYSPGNPEDSVVRQVTDLWLFQGRYRVPIDEAYPGQLVLVGGVDDTVLKGATLVGVEGPGGAPAPDVEIFRAPSVGGIAGCVKVSCEPLKPSELPKMIRGLRCLMRSYVLLYTRVEDSGEHALLGSGELMIDCALHDLRKLYGDLEIKVADPVVALQETVIEESAAMAYAVSANGKNKLTCVASPLEEDLVKAIDGRQLDRALLLDPTERAAMLEKQFGYNELDAKSVWSFGPNQSNSTGLNGDGTCALVDESLPDALSPQLKAEVRDYLIQGFHWITREGPLLEEPIRQTKFRLIDFDLADEGLHRGGGQLVPAARKAFYNAFLLATPRIMEPILFAEIVCSANAVQACFDVLARRRGYVVKDQPKAGTPLFEVHAYIPSMDAFGFETDIRTHTSGQAMVLQFFDHWSVVPGDPLDRSILLRPLEPSPAPHLAREFTLKTRRRKGLTEDVQLSGVTWDG